MAVQAPPRRWRKVSGESVLHSAHLSLVVLLEPLLGEKLGRAVEEPPEQGADGAGEGDVRDGEPAVLGTDLKDYHPFGCYNELVQRRAGRSKTTHKDKE